MAGRVYIAPAMPPDSRSGVRGMEGDGASGSGL